MSTPNKYQPQNNVIIFPHCPYCDAELEGVGLYNWGAPGKAVILCVFCMGCKKSLHLQVVAPDASAEPSMIARPS